MMTKQDEMAVEVLGSLIANITAGNIRSLGIEAVPMLSDTVEIQMRFQGRPDEKLRLKIAAMEG